MGNVSSTLTLLVIIALLGGCASEPTPAPKSTSLPLPTPAVSEYVKTEGAGFDIQDGTEIRYAMTYLLRKEIGDNPSFMVEFENPVDGQLSLANGGMLEPGDTRIVVSSPLLPCIENHRNYRVELKLFSVAHLVAEHRDMVQFSVPADVMAEVGVRECSAGQP